MLRYLHFMIEDALFSLQMYTRPLQQSELRGEKKMAISGWLEGVACRMGGDYDPQTDRQTDPQTQTHLLILERIGAVGITHLKEEEGVYN